MKENEREAIMVPRGSLLGVRAPLVCWLRQVLGFRGPALDGVFAYSEILAEHL